MTFPTGVIEIRKCSDEELKTMFDEAREASNHSRKLGRVMVNRCSSPSQKDERIPRNPRASNLGEDE